MCRGSGRYRAVGDVGRGREAPRHTRHRGGQPATAAELMSAVSEDFPTLHALLGPKRFDSLILAYLEENPSTSWTLRDLGAKLPAFLDRHPELTGRRHHLAVDVARLEWAYVEAFDGKQLIPLAAEDVHAVGPDTQLFLQPHLQLLSLATQSTTWCLP